MWPPDQARAAASHLPHGAGVTVPGAGHVAALLQAAPVLTRLIVDFWQDPVGAVGRHTGTTRGSVPG